MEIPVIIHKDASSVYGVTVPDVPGCFSYGESIDEALRNAKEAIHSHIEVLLEDGQAVSLAPSPIDDLLANEDYAGGIWALVDVNLSKLDTKPERINISIPRFVLEKVDAYAQSRHESRSGLLARAALRLIAEETKEKSSGRIQRLCAQTRLPAKPRGPPSTTPFPKPARRNTSPRPSSTRPPQPPIMSKPGTIKPTPWTNIGLPQHLIRNSTKTYAT